MTDKRKDEMPTRETERDLLVKEVGECCMGCDPFCSAGGCLVEKALRKRSVISPPVPDDVAEAVKWAIDVKELSDIRISGEEFYADDHAKSKHLETLIRAAGTPSAEDALDRLQDTNFKYGAVAGVYDDLYIIRKALKSNAEMVKLLQEIDEQLGDLPPWSTRLKKVLSTQRGR